MFTRHVRKTISCPYNTTRLELLVDAMLPDLLLSSCRIGTRRQDSLHLLDACEHDLPSNEPPNTLGARWAGQAALVRPELVEVLDALHGECEIHLESLFSLQVIETNHGRKLLEEGAVEVTRIQTEGENSAFMALAIYMDEVHFGLAAIAVDRVVGRGVDVPAFQIECLVVVRKAWMRCPIAVMSKRECRAIAPVEEVTRSFARVVEGWYVVERETVSKG